MRKPACDIEGIVRTRTDRDRVINFILWPVLHSLGEGVSPAGEVGKVIVVLFDFMTNMVMGGSSNCNSLLIGYLLLTIDYLNLKTTNYFELRVLGYMQNLKPNGSFELNI